MNKNIAKLCLILANSELTRSQLSDACEWIERNGGKSLERIVYRIRRAALNAVSEEKEPIPTFNSTQLLLGEESVRHSTVLDPAVQVEHLLRNEAGLTTLKARELLLKSLEENHSVEVSSLPKLKKQSFRNWIRRLSQIISYSVLLHEATRIRNEIIKKPAYDWPLRNDSGLQ